MRLHCIFVAIPITILGVAFIVWLDPNSQLHVFEENVWLLAYLSTCHVSCVSIIVVGVLQNLSKAPTSDSVAYFFLFETTCWKSNNSNQMVNLIKKKTEMPNPCVGVF